jgi:hypothetical protein
MPYEIRKSGDGFKVFKKGTNQAFSKHPMTKEKAKAQIAAIHINTTEAVNAINELKLSSYGVKELLRAIFDHPEILPKLHFRKFRDVIDYMKSADQEEQEELEQKVIALGIKVDKSHLTELSIVSVGVRDLLRKIFKDPNLMKQLNFSNFRRAVEYVRGCDIEDFNELEQEVEAYEKAHGLR